MILYIQAKIFSIFSILGFDTFDSTLTIDQKIYLEYVNIINMKYFKKYNYKIIDVYK